MKEWQKREAIEDKYGMYSTKEIERKKRERDKCLTEVWDRLIKFDDEHFPGWREEGEVYYTNALAGEVGELCNKVKHRLGGGTKPGPPPSLEDLMEEVADVFIYLSLFVERIGKHSFDVTTLADAVNRKITKNEQRLQGAKRVILSEPQHV